MTNSELFQKALEKRKQVLGEKYVDANLAGSDEFMMTFQRAVTELAWGYAWSRPGLDQKTRSLLTLGILGGLGRFQELGIYVNAALASGATVDEIKEAFHGQAMLDRTSMNTWEDAAVIKEINVHKEGVGVQLHFDITNVLNHFQASNPSSLSITSPTSFGTITGQANTPRNMEFGIRVHF